MPGWYVHLDMGRGLALELTDPGLPADYPLTVNERANLAAIAHRWRNYLSAGALGPDLFFLLPDFKGTSGAFLYHAAQVVLQDWEAFDQNFLEVWESWVTPLGDAIGDILGNLTGDVSVGLGEALSNLTSAGINFVLGLTASTNDWLGLFTSGVAFGYDDSSMFWSDMFHYRKTSTFTQTLLGARHDLHLDAPPANFLTSGELDSPAAKHLAFALGWLSHVATDVTAHPFTNAKTGGPYRLHWQRHHLVENHMDAWAYQQHPPTYSRQPDPTNAADIGQYADVETSALHLRLAFFPQSLAGYSFDPASPDTADGPVNDFFPNPDETGAPPRYPIEDNTTAAAARHSLIDVDSNKLPEELCQWLKTAMQTVFGDQPRILINTDRLFPTDHVIDDGSGRPSVTGLQDMYDLVYRYVKMSTTSGFSPRRPAPPDILPPVSFPMPPGVGGPTDPGAAEPPHDPSFWEDLLAILAIILYIGELGVWLATVLPGIIATVATFPIREAIFNYLEVPAFTAYQAARQMLSDNGYLIPTQHDLRPGLVTLGTSTRVSGAAVLEALGSTDPEAVLLAARQVDEPSGIPTTSPPAHGYGADAAFPRMTVKDPAGTLSAITHLTGRAGYTPAPSQFLHPMNYPSTNEQGATVGFEAPLTHPGPYRQGQTPTEFYTMLGRDDTRQLYEAATTPEQTEALSSAALTDPSAHLGGPVDFGIWLLGRLWTDTPPTAEFNLDADRGYGFQCWDYVRHAQHTPQPLPPHPTTAPADVPSHPTEQWANIPDAQRSAGHPADYVFAEPVTPPPGYNAPDGVHHASHYDQHHNLWIGYPRSMPAPVDLDSTLDLEVDEATMTQAGTTPLGERTDVTDIPDQGIGKDIPPAKEPPGGGPSPKGAGPDNPNQGTGKDIPPAKEPPGGGLSPKGAGPDIPNQGTGKDNPPAKEPPGGGPSPKGPVPGWQEAAGDPKAVAAKLEEMLASGRVELTKAFGPIAGKPLNRRDALWPFLLMRAWLPWPLFPDVDQGQRPGPSWASSTQWGPQADLDVIDGAAVRVRVWNLGRVPAIGARVRVFFAYFTTTTAVLNATPIDSEIPATQAGPTAPTSDRAYVRLAGQTYLDIDAVDSGRCTTIATIPLALTDDIVASSSKVGARFNGWSTGHLVTVVDSVMDVAGGFFNAQADRHVTSWQPLPVAFPTR